MFLTSVLSQTEGGDSIHRIFKRLHYLRYYLIEATSHVKEHCSEFATYYKKKYAEVKLHQHKRALALTARKFVRLIFGLLANHQLYSSDRVEQS